MLLELRHFWYSPDRNGILFLFSLKKKKIQCRAGRLFIRIIKILAPKNNIKKNRF